MKFIHMRFTRYRIREMRNSYRILVGILKGKKPHERPRRRWANIKLDARGIWRENMDRFNLSQNRV